MDQDVATTRERVEQGTCFVARLGEDLVGTLTVGPAIPDPASHSGSR